MTTLTKETSPYAAGAPWPCMRADIRNSGCSPLLHDLQPLPDTPRLRRWSTGNGIFSTPVIGADETIYVGSADKNFYAFDPLSGSQRWSYPTGECIDSAGCIAADGTVYFASCDAALYGLSPSGEERWRLNLFGNRRHFTPSTIFWWEGNVVLGPNRLLYAGNDDFNFYAIEPGQGVRWAYLTGLHIWSAPAFGADGSVFFFSFDCHGYKLERETGRVLWSINTGNFVVSSPALGHDGTVYFGSFDAHVYALDGATGAVRWRTPTAGPIYASPALADDGSVYIGSSDGRLYALDAACGRVRWTFYTGDAVRASASIGPDPEGRAPYLVYFGSGNGVLYAVDPHGARRWSLSTIAEGAELDSPNINASIALGRSGIAAATASGHVFYVPYDHYRTADDAAIVRLADDGYPWDGVFLHFMNPGGGMAAAPISATGQGIVVEPSQPISLRLLARRSGRTQTARLETDGLEVTLEPARPFRVKLQPDRVQLNIVPDGGDVDVSEGWVNVRARCRLDGGAASTIEARAALRFAPARDTPAIEALSGMPFRVTHMSVYDPAIVPSFDQIGIASLTMQVRIVHVDAASGRVVAWGVEKFGLAAAGDAVQVAIPRHLFYAFAGTYENGRLVLSARDCSFELTAFPVPLDELRLSGTWQGADGPRLGSSLLVELDVAKRLRWSWRDAPRLSSSLDLASLAAFARRWVPDLATAVRSLPAFLRLLARALPLGLRILRRDMYGPWGLIGEDGCFRGVGSFRSAADVDLDASTFEVQHFHFDAAAKQVIAEIAARPGYERTLNGALPAIVIVDERKHELVELHYTAATHIDRDTGRVRVVLQLPASAVPVAARLRAYLLLDVTPLAQIQIA